MGLFCLGIYICKIVTISQLSCPAVIISVRPEDNNRVTAMPAIIKMFIEQNPVLIYLQYFPI